LVGMPLMVIRNREAPTKNCPEILLVVATASFGYRCHRRWKELSSICRKYRPEDRMADQIDTTEWRRIESPKGLWDTPGVVAIRDGMTGRTYVIAGIEVGKRLGHATYLLDRGQHHNASLQQDWTDHREEFQLYLVQRCGGSALRVFKQHWLDRVIAMEGGTYNCKRSTPRTPSRRKAIYPSWAYDPPPDDHLRRLFDGVRVALRDGDELLAGMRKCGVH
jgi:hypothetical protein